MSDSADRIKVQKKAAFTGLLRLASQEKKLLCGTVLVLVTAVSLDAVAKMTIRNVVDGVLDLHLDLSGLLMVTLLYLGLITAQGFFSFLEGRGRTLAAENLARSLREKLYDHIQRLSFSFHDRTSSGELVQRTTSDVDTVRRFFADHILGFIRIVFLFVIHFIALSIISLKLALIASVIVPVIIFVSVFFFGRIYRAYSEYQDQEAVLTTFVQENIVGNRVVRSFARHDHENHNFDKHNARHRDKGYRVVFWHTLYWPLAYLLCGMQMIGATLFAGLMVIRGELTLGSMIAGSFLINSLIWPMQDMGRLITEISRGIVSFGRIKDILDEKTEGKDEEPGIILEQIRGEVTFDKVCFCYVDDTPVLNDVSFTCKPGETIALLGKTGCGKSSIINLLLRFYDVTAGEIRLDGVNLRKLDRESLRKQIGLVEQDPFLFTDTIEGNIAYGVHRNVTRKEVEEAADAAAIHSSIMELKDGYETLVGEKGVSLSGGQKQRIAIARALLKNPHILILDDSTSAVDACTESLIQRSLDRLMQGRTTFIIAHRVQTLMKADKILVMEQGCVTQWGNHRELMSKPGFYRRIIGIQARCEEQAKKEIMQGRKKSLNPEVSQ
ncbi:Lipid A export ATP-binding/permease protein MsbA [Chitinispirillum alkaliphilum]|nr:Lipid A export ATP-binding/permease protein MsbA [Chitinispirillum alkaliphilum]